MRLVKKSDIKVGTRLYKDGFVAVITWVSKTETKHYCLNWPDKTRPNKTSISTWRSTGWKIQPFSDYYKEFKKI